MSAKCLLRQITIAKVIKFFKSQLFAMKNLEKMKKKLL